MGSDNDGSSNNNNIPHPNDDDICYGHVVPHNDNRKNTAINTKNINTMNATLNQQLRRRPEQASHPDSRSPSPRSRSVSPARHSALHANQHNGSRNAFTSNMASSSTLFSSSSSSSVCGRSHWLVLLSGMMLGYLLLPVLLIEVQLSDLLERLPEPTRASGGHHGSGTRTAIMAGGLTTASGPRPVVREQNYFLRQTDGRALEGVQDDNRVRSNSRSALVLQDSWAGENTIASDVEKRLMEDHDILSKQSMPTATTPYIMKTKVLPDHQRKKILVTGGAGFVGSHLVDKLMMEGHEVIVVDNFFTGQKRNIAHWLHHPLFSVIVHDVTEPIQLEVDQIYHLACPASPPHYQYNPVKTIKTSTMGTLNMLGLAKRVRARILLTSTSEIYGDPKVHPQPESYWGNVNTIGPRSCYDEGKRVAETMMYSYKNQNNVEIRVARIFNTFGPRMHPNDGRVVSNFIIQALQNKNMTIYGDGMQTRSFQYVSDLVDGLHRLMNGDYDMPVNLGNPEEFTVKDFATYIKEMAKSESQIIHLRKSEDDPQQRQPDISTAKRELDWEPQIQVQHGLEKTIAYFGRVLKEAGEIIPTGPGAAKPEA